MKAVVFTLGCKVNDCESASLISGLKELGYEVNDELGFADVYIVNTCAVTGEAEKKSRQSIARIRKYNKNAKIIICGCATEKNPQAFLNKPNVFLVTGARNKSKVLSLIKNDGEFIDDSDNVFDELKIPEHIKTRAYVKIQDGCNNFCSYCIVPYLRGRSRSRDLESIIAEIKTLTAKEVVLTGIDISSYNDKNGNKLADLIYALKDFDIRVRLGSLEVNVIDEKLLNNLKSLKDFAPQFHLSLQSGSNDVLKKMNRRYTREQYIEKCNLIKKYFDLPAITTDIIVGFPFETEENFCDSLKIIGEVGFSQIHCFSFSPREGTVAYKFKDIDAKIKKERLIRLMQTAEDYKLKYINKYLGRTVTMIAEEEKDGEYVGYSENYIRLYLTEKPKEEIFKVKIIKAYKDGAFVEII